MGAKSKRKGKRAEREVVALARTYGLEASRRWQTAQSADPNECVRDLRIAGDYYQVQVQANGFKRIYQELEGVRGFFFRRDRGEWLVALRVADYLALLKSHFESSSGSPIGQPMTDDTKSVALSLRR